MKKYIVSVFTDFGRDGHGECGYHEVEVSATNEQTAISEAESIVMGEVEQGSVIIESNIIGYYEEESKAKKNYNVYTQNGWGAEKFYIEDENQDTMIFEARSEEHAIFQAAEHIRETSMYDADTTEGWINMQNWYAEEV